MNGKSARILLIFVFAARGTSFLFSKLLLQDLSPMNVIAVRFLLAFLVLALVFHKKIRGCSRAALRGGLILGAEYTFLMILEMYGLRLVDSGVSSLIEHMAVVLVPLFTAFLARTLPKKKDRFLRGARGRRGRLPVPDAEQQPGRHAGDLPADPGGAHLYLLHHDDR